MPVGRISYMHLEPFSFEEFLTANGKESLNHYISIYSLEKEIPYEIHEQLIRQIKEYLIVGGMPAAVASWTHTRSLTRIHQIHNDLLATYIDDFARYRGRLAIERLEETFLHIPKCLGEKFIYSKVSDRAQGQSIKQSLDMLCMARICHPVFNCSGNGIPLAAEVNKKHRKMLFVDTGLCLTSLGLSLPQFLTLDDIFLINKGGVAEQLVGQILRTLPPPYVEPSLYYWHREERTSSAEIDYLLAQQNTVVPLEVKAGSAGSLKSLHLFMHLKKSPVAVRVNTDKASLVQVNVKNQDGSPISYLLLSIPFYLLGQLPRLLGAIISSNCKQVLTH